MNKQDFSWSDFLKQKHDYTELEKRGVKVIKINNLYLKTKKESNKKEEK